MYFFKHSLIVNFHNLIVKILKIPIILWNANFINILLEGVRRLHRIWWIHFIDLVVRNFLGTSRLDVDLQCSRWKKRIRHWGKIETSIADDGHFYILSKSDDVTTVRLFPFLYYWHRQILCLYVGNTLYYLWKIKMNFNV